MPVPYSFKALVKSDIISQGRTNYDYRGVPAPCLKGLRAAILRQAARRPSENREWEKLN